MTGGTSTPIEDLRDVACWILANAGHARDAGRRREARRRRPRRRRDPGRPDHIAAEPDARRSARPAPPDPVVAHPGGLPVVAVVGRPNVGKSTLFNRIVGGRTAIVEDRARTTRDRLYGDAEWNGRRFVVVDTGGLELDPDDPIEARVQEQARLAIARGRRHRLRRRRGRPGMTPADSEAANILRRAKAPVIVAVNKADNEQRELEGAEFYALGWDETYAISAQRTAAAPATCSMRSSGRCRPRASGRSPARPARPRPRPGPTRSRPAGSSRTSSVSDADATDERRRRRRIPMSTSSAIDPEAATLGRGDGGRGRREPAAIAFVGRPNVGKSSLLNALLGEERAIVSEVPGTTRDAIDTRLAWGRSEVVLIDTAGIRRRGKVASRPGGARSYSTLRALHALSRADVAVLVIDAVEG